MFDNKIFEYGQENYKQSRVTAISCKLFKADDEDEQVDSVLLSCYNCRYRRWTSTSFKCMKI
jgi:hypothetical protein